MKFKFRNALLALAAFAMVGGLGAGIALGNAKDATVAEAGGNTTLTVNIKDIANYEKYTSTGNKLSELPIAEVYEDSVVTITGASNGNNGKVYGTVKDGVWSAANWRFYVGDSGYFTVAVSSGYSLVSVTSTHSGTLQYNDENIKSNTPVSLPSQTSATFTCTVNAQVSKLVVVYTTASTDPELFVDETTNSTVGLVDSLFVTYANLTANINVTQSSTNGGAILLSTDGESYENSLVLPYTESSPKRIYVKGKTAGTVNLSFATTGVTTKTCVVTVAEPVSYEKISNAAKIKNGGLFVIASASDSTKVMGNGQGGNNRPGATAVVEDEKVIIGAGTTAAIVTIAKATGNYAGYYTLYEALGEKYFYAASGGNYLKTAALVADNDAYYWAITFSGDDAVITNKGNGSTIRFNESSTLFSCYASGQNPIALFERSSDIPVEVALTFISGSDSTVEAGSNVVFHGTYLPANATENIVATSSNEKLTFGAISMDGNGNFEVVVTADIELAEGNYTITFDSDNPTSSVTPKAITFAVTSYEATHTLVTEAASLVNGAKVIIACTAENHDFSAEASTGANNLNGTATAFGTGKATLSKAATSQEFTVWCVDETNGYYVFSDGGYFLSSPNGKNNYLQRNDKLTEACYFTITDGEGGVVIQNSYGVNHGWTEVTTPYTIGFNVGTSKFSLYANVGTTSVANASLYLANGDVDTVGGFVDAFLHFGNVAKTEAGDTNACRGSGSGAKGYYTAAKDAFNSLTTAQQNEFFSKSGAGQIYEDAFLRLQGWAIANGETFTVEKGFAAAPSNVAFGTAESRATLFAVLGVLGLGALAGAGMFFISKKRKRA